MPNNIEIVKAELNELGYKTELIGTPAGRTVVAFSPFTIKVGEYRGEVVTAGVAFHPGEENYPEYPPHWVGVTPPRNDNKGGAVESFQDNQGRQWILMSRPPKDVWDRLTPRDMEGYIREHLNRMWA